MLERILVGGCLAAIMATSAMAFEVERSGGETTAPKSDQPPAAHVVAPAPGPKTQAGGGTEVRIPGLGRIGVLPKLDFGLELLYGTEKRSLELVEPTDKPMVENPDDFRIRGSIKHRF